MPPEEPLAPWVSPSFPLALPVAGLGLPGARSGRAWQGPGEVGYTLWGLKSSPPGGSAPRSLQTSGGRVCPARQAVRCDCCRPLLLLAAGTDDAGPSGWEKATPRALVLPRRGRGNRPSQGYTQISSLPHPTEDLCSQGYRSHMCTHNSQHSPLPPAGVPESTSHVPGSSHPETLGGR